MILAVIDGDARHAALAALLREDGHETPAYAPGMEAEGYLFPLPTRAHPLLDALPPGALALVGGAEGQYPRLRLRDYYAREEIQIENAALTAEGAVWTAIQAAEDCLWRARVLVLGYGRVGRALAQRLLGLGARVYVYARRAESRAWASVSGCETLSALPPRLEGWDFVFNTVPARILDAAAPGAVNIELASPPGGFADPSGVCVARGLPGKTAPRAAARVLKRAVDCILKEEFSR